MPGAFVHRICVGFFLGFCLGFSGDDGVGFVGGFVDDGFLVICLPFLGDGVGFLIFGGGILGGRCGCL